MSTVQSGLEDGKQPYPQLLLVHRNKVCSKIKALRRVNNNTLMKQEGLWKVRREGREMDTVKGECISEAGKAYPPR